VKNKHNQLNKYILIGAVTGFIIGILIFILFMKGLFDEELYYYSFGFPFVLFEGLGRYLNLCNHLECLIFHIIGGVLSYLFIGGIIGFIIYKIGSAETL